ncbi:MAG: hypothetical protein QNL02_03640, partial [Paracoccaceae bacterium]
MAVFTQVSRRPVAFVLPVMGLMGALVGLFVGPAFGSAVVGIVFGATLSMILAYGIIVTDHLSRKAVRWLLPVLLAVLGLLFIGLTGVLFGALFGWFFGWFVYWIHEGEYRVKLHPYLTAGQVLWHYSFRVICGLIFGFLITPILVVMPLSFNAQDFFTFNDPTRDWYALPEAARATMARQMRLVTATEPGAVQDSGQTLAPGLMEGFTPPVLLIGGDRSPEVFPAILKALNKRFTAPRSATIAGAGHMVPLTHLDETSAVINRW